MTSVIRLEFELVIEKTQKWNFEVRIENCTRQDELTFLTIFATKINFVLSFYKMAMFLVTLYYANIVFYKPF